jgi:hypothetical protein
MAKLTTNKNFLSPVGFVFKIDTTSFANTEYFCTSVAMPGISMTEVAVPYRGVNLAYTGDRLTFDDLTIRFNITENMENYIEIYDWMHNIAQHKSAEGFKYDASLMIMTSHNNVVKEIAFQEIFPTSLSAVEFNSQNTDIQYIQADVTFKYTLFDFRK